MWQVQWKFWMVSWNMPRTLACWGLQTVNNEITEPHPTALLCVGFLFSNSSVRQLSFDFIILTGSDQSDSLNNAGHIPASLGMSRSIYNLSEPAYTRSTPYLLPLYQVFLKIKLKNSVMILKNISSFSNIFVLVIWVEHSFKCYSSYQDYHHRLITSKLKAVRGRRNTQI